MLKRTEADALTMAEYPTLEAAVMRAELGGDCDGSVW